MERMWSKELRERQPSLLRAILGMLGKDIAIGSIWGVMNGLLATVARPLVLRAVVNELVSDTLTPAGTAMLLALLSLVVLLEGVSLVNARHILGEASGSQFISATFALLLDKVVQLPQGGGGEPVAGAGAGPLKGGASKPGAVEGNSRSTAKDGTKGASDPGAGKTPSEANEANLFGGDVMRRFWDFFIAAFIPISVSAIVGGIAVLCVVLGMAALPGLGVMFLLLLINARLGLWSGKLEKKNLDAADKRVGLVSEIVNSIKAVKFFAWEEAYLSKIDRLRAEECKGIRTFRLVQNASVITGRISPVVSAMVSIVSFGLLGNELQAGDVFATIAIFQSMRMAVITLPMAFISIATIRTSVRRLQQFLMLKGQSPRHLTAPVTEGGSPRAAPAVEFRNATLSWACRRTGSDGNFTAPVQENKPLLSSHAPPKLAGGLRHLSFTVNSKSLTAVVGPVGSGKTTLLMGLIGELHPSAGRISTHPSMAYVPQHPFVFSGTVQENVLFGRPYDAQRLEACLQQSDFSQDLSQLASGLDTEVGERGTTLSGGQQQRLSIARALYGDPALLVLDDALSAVDAEVASAIFERAIESRRAAGKAVVMACNQLQFLARFDHIIYLQDNSIHEQGSYAALMAKEQGRVRELVANFSFGGDNSLVQDIGADRGSVDGLEPQEEPTACEQEAGAGANSLGEYIEVTDEQTPPGASPASTPNASEAAHQDLEAGQKPDIASGKEQASSGASVKEETKQGSVGFTVYLTYIRAMGWSIFVLCWFLYICSYAALVGGDVSLLKWVEAETEALAGNDGTVDQARFIRLYAGLSGAYSLACLIGTLLMCLASYKASQNIHHNVISRILYAPYSWFQENPIGRIVSRFT